MSSPVVRIDEVTRFFEKGIGVMDLNLEVPEGTCYALIGPNGAGKSTTLRLVMGMLRPGRGTVSVFGEDPSAQPIHVKQRIGYVSEDQHLPTNVCPADIFRLFQSLYPTWDAAYEIELVERLELPLWRNLGRLSTGQRRQVALIGALAHRPKLLVLDEPAGGLDPLVRRSFLEEVIEVLGEQGSTVLFSSHHLDQVERLSDRIGFLYRGKLILDGEAASLRDHAYRYLVEGPAKREPFERVPGYLAARKRENRWAVTVLGDPEAAKRALEEKAKGHVLQEQHLGLEDLFVDLMRPKNR